MNLPDLLDAARHRNSALSISLAQLIRDFEQRALCANREAIRNKPHTKARVIAATRANCWYDAAQALRKEFKI